MMIVDVKRWDSIEPFCHDLERDNLTSEGVPVFLQRWSDLYKAVLEDRARLKARVIRFPEDEAARHAFETCQEATMPLWMATQERLTEKLLAVDGFQPRAEHRQMIRRFHNQHGLFRGESVPVAAELSSIEGEWRRLFESMRAWDGGESVSLAATQARLPDLDRVRRETAWRAINDAWLAQRHEIGQLFLKSLHLRRRLARIAGLHTFLAFRWREMDRLDYTPASAVDFQDAVASEIVPLAARLLAPRRSRLGLSSLRPWDLAVDRASRSPLHPFNSVVQLEEGVARILTHVDPETGALFDRMRQGWMDLAPKSGKPGGGEEWFFPQSGMPYIVANAVGTHANVLTVLHESGHAAHDFISRQHQELIWTGGGPTEFEELAASAMVFLADPYVEHRHGGFYTSDQASQGREANIEYSVHFLRQVALVDAFEQWAYTVDPDSLSLDALGQKWLELSQRFDPDVDWGGLRRERSNGWLQFSSFYFSNPCYFLTYGFSMVGAFQLWRKAQSDQTAALPGTREHSPSVTRNRSPRCSNKLEHTYRLIEIRYAKLWC